MAIAEVLKNIAVGPFFTYSFIILYWVYVLYPIGGAGVLCPPLLALVAPYCAIYGHVHLLSGALFLIPVPA